jgi:ketosteroid isomerase-like protein
MRKTAVGILVVVLAVLLVTPSVLAQATPEEVVQNYYTALGEAATTGDATGLLDLFADEATISVVGLTPEPVAGKAAIQGTMGGMFALLQGLTVTVGEVTVEGDQVTVAYTMAVEGMGEIPATDTFVIADGQIQSLAIQLSPEAMAGLVQPVLYDLPETGGPVIGFLPGLLVLGGGAIVALSRRFSR